MYILLLVNVPFIRCIIIIIISDVPIFRPNFIINLPNSSAPFEVIRIQQMVCFRSVRMKCSDFEWLVDIIKCRLHKLHSFKHAMQFSARFDEFEPNEELTMAFVHQMVITKSAL